MTGTGYTGPSTLSGRLVAPDGATPIAGATVYVPQGASAQATAQATLSQATCAEPDEAFVARTCTGADGSFVFEAPIENGSATINVRKGVFRFSQAVQVNAASADLGAVAMPQDLSANSTKLAVVTGAFDRMEDVLAKLGFGTLDGSGSLQRGSETFDLFDGDQTLPFSYLRFSTLFEDGNGDGEPDLNNYDIVFLNCGADESFVLSEPVAGAVGSRVAHGHTRAESSAAAMGQAERDMLRDYVEQGGALYVTDLMYDYVEQVFPEFIDFYRSNHVPTDQPEVAYVAEVGREGITTDASILDSDLRDWLAGVDCGGASCLNSDGSVHIEGFLPGWALMRGPHPASPVKFWAEGDVSWIDLTQPSTGVMPLTATFEVGAGKVIFSSYHTEEEPTPQWTPQERILQYLVFQ